MPFGIWCLVDTYCRVGGGASFRRRDPWVATRSTTSNFSISYIKYPSVQSSSKALSRRTRQLRAIVHLSPPPIPTEPQQRYRRRITALQRQEPLTRPRSDDLFHGPPQLFFGNPFENHQAKHESPPPSFLWHHIAPWIVGRGWQNIFGLYHGCQGRRGNPGTSLSTSDAFNSQCASILNLPGHFFRYS